MIFWVFVSLLLLGALASLALPLLGKARPAVLALDHDKEVYRARLEEIDADVALQRIGTLDGEAAKSEAGRKLLALSAAPDSKFPLASFHPKKTLFAAMLAFLPTIAVLGYLAWGQPAMPDMAFAARADADPAKQSIEQLIARAEARLEANPGDVRGWKVVAPIYMRLGRYDDAVAAWRSALRIEPNNPEIKASLGESMVVAGQGIVSKQAGLLFEESLVLAPDDAKPRFYLAIALSQQGELAKAETAWRELIGQAPANAPWLEVALAQLNAVLEKSGKPAETPLASANGPSTADIAAANEMSPEARQAMIEGMVASLAEKLKADPSDKPGWLKLVRAWQVLGEREKALEAIAGARQGHAADLAFAGELAELESELRKTGSSQ